jgi:hypothetical protein
VYKRDGDADGGTAQETHEKHSHGQAHMGPCAVLVLLAAPFVSGCTTLIAGRGATADGSVMATHSDDGESGGDSRVVKVPAMDWVRGSKRPIYYATEDYPRFVGDRGVDAYLPANNPGASPKPNPHPTTPQP